MSLQLSDEHSFIEFTDLPTYAFRGPPTFCLIFTLYSHPSISNVAVSQIRGIFSGVQRIHSDFAMGSRIETTGHLE